MNHAVAQKQTLVFLQCLCCEGLTFALADRICQHCGSDEVLPTICGQRNPLLIPATACAHRPDLRVVKHSLGNWYVQEGHSYLGWIRGGGRRWLATSPAADTRKPFRTAQDALAFLIDTQRDAAAKDDAKTLACGTPLA